jgi:hypothetical protein
MSNDKQNSVEWLFSEINRIRLEEEMRNISTFEFFTLQGKAFEQAKAMHKEEQRLTWDNGMKSDNGFFGTFDEYYEQTFGGNK